MICKRVTYQNSIFLDIGHQVYDRTSNNDLCILIENGKK